MRTVGRTPRTNRCHALWLFVAMLAAGCTPGLPSGPPVVSGTVFALDYSEDGKVLAAGGGHYKKNLYNLVRLWDPEFKEILSFSGNGNAFFSLAFIPNSSLLAAGDGTTFFLFDTKTGETRFQGPPKWGAVYALDVSKAGDLLATSHWDRVARVWKVPEGDLKHELRGHTQTVTAVAMAPRGDLLITGADRGDGNLIIWNLEDGTTKQTLSAAHSDRIVAIDIHPDGDLFASAGHDGEIKVWSLSSDKPLQTMKHEQGVRSLAFSPDGSLLASGGADHVIRFWNPRSGKEENTLTVHRGQVTSLAFAPSGELLASGSHDDTVQLSNWKTGATRTIDLLKKSPP